MPAPPHSLVLSSDIFRLLRHHWRIHGQTCVFITKTVISFFSKSPHPFGMTFCSFPFSFYLLFHYHFQHPHLIFCNKWFRFLSSWESDSIVCFLLTHCEQHHFRCLVILNWELFSRQAWIAVWLSFQKGLTVSTQCPSKLSNYVHWSFFSCTSPNHFNSAILNPKDREKEWFSILGETIQFSLPKAQLKKANSFSSPCTREQILPVLPFHSIYLPLQFPNMGEGLSSNSLLLKVPRLYVTF